MASAAISVLLFFSLFFRIFVFLDQDIRVELLVVEVIELHGATFERMRYVSLFFLIYSRSWY